MGEQVNLLDAVILLDWSDRSLEKQVKLGAKTGDINPDLARVEITNYRSNIIPIAHFFDQQSNLHVVNSYFTFLLVLDSVDFIRLETKSRRILPLI